MSRQELIEYLQSKNVVTKNCKRKFCWKRNFDADCKKHFDEFSKNYRTEQEAWFCLLNNIEPYHCEVCGNLAKFTGTKKTAYPGYNTTCECCSANSAIKKKLKFNNTIANRTDEQRKSIIEKRKHTNLIVYGDANYTLYGSKSFKQMMKDRYGDEYYNNRKKSKQTCLKRYGVECNLSLVNSSEKSKRIWKDRYDEIIEKIKQTNLFNIGTEFPGQCKEVVQKIIKTKFSHVSKIETEYNCTQQKKLFKKYGRGWLKLDLEKIVIDNRTFISNEYISLIKQYATEPRKTSFSSNEEKELLSYIKEIYNGQIEENVTNVVSNNNHRYYELDIYLPDKHIAFDFDGMYWHSDKFKDKYYHQRKTILCYAQGVQLVHIYENDWKENKNKIKQQIQELLDGNDCSSYNWVSLNNINDYVLTEPNNKTIYNLTLYDEGTFIKKPNIT